MKSLVCAACLALLFIPTASFAQQRPGQGAGNQAKAQACRMETSSRMRQVGGRSGGNNPGASRAQARMLFQQCMAR
jgi:hypothetical protein